MKSILAIQMPIKERLADLTRRVDLNAKETLVRVLDRPGLMDFLCSFTGTCP